MNSVELLERKSALKERVYSILELCQSEIRMCTDEETKEINDIKEEIEKLNNELDEMNVTLPDEEEEKEKNNSVIMEKNFSLLSAIRNVANNKPMDELTLAVLNAGENQMRNSGISGQGQIMLPTSELRTAISVASEGTDTVATDLFDIVAPLKARNVLINAGAKFITGLVGDVQYPVMSEGSCYWESEVGTPEGDANISFSQVKLSPKRLTTSIAISKQFLLQDSVGAENAIREEIINAINTKLESTILGNANGTSTMPKGLLYSATTLPVVDTYAEICDTEATLETSNFYGEMKYILSPKSKGTLRSIQKANNNGSFIMENGEIDGTTVLSTSNVPSKYGIYGDFTQLLIGQWGSIDLTVDNITLAANGQIKLIINVFFDAKPLRENAFAPFTTEAV